MEENRNDEKPIITNPSDHLANERTFLAWIRTAIALMGFGFVVVKFALFIRQISLALHEPGMPQPTKGYSSQIGTGWLPLVLLWHFMLISVIVLPRNSFRCISTGHRTCLLYWLLF